MDSTATPTIYSRDLVFAGANAPVHASRTVLDGDFELHSHDFVEIMVIGGGHGIHWTVMGRQPLQEGDLYILRPGAWHAYLACTRLVVFNCCFGLELLQRELAWLGDDARLNYLLHSGPLRPDGHCILATRLAPGALAACRARLTTLHKLTGSGERDKADLVGQLLLVLAELARAADIGRELEDRRRVPVHAAVAAGVRLMEEDLAHDWSLPELAASLHLNASYLARLFKSCTGRAPMAYLAHRRAELAGALLLRTKYPIARVGEETGWSDPNYFARRFRAHFGMSARAYRERHGLAGSKPDHTHSYVWETAPPDSP